MTTYLYLSLIPQALIASMLPPEDFGAYFSVGSAKRSRGQALFFSVDRAQLDAGDFPLDYLDERCVAHTDGSPKRSLYLSIYRVLEKVPLAALTALHLVTDDGRVLTLSPSEFAPDGEERAHLYQEFCPVQPRVVSSLDPSGFTSFITDSSQPVHVPRIVFAELTLGNLKNNVDALEIDNLPYPNIGHLRDCLRELAADPSKPTKTVLRQMTQEVLFRTIRNGFFVGDADGIVAFTMPSQDELEREHFAWWRSAQSAFGY
ncbi:hypothetical protein [Demequina aurantiaca]|uniref:hypothetical protein n=1 Tax=Demequina aurantiaca TaxID=676200 RepID=UPI003D331809